MASRAFLMVMMAAVAIAPAMAADYMVGDNAGWKLNVSYTKWAEGKDFRVGDRLVFNYTQGSHNVMNVSKAEFDKCASSNTTQTPFVSGHDVIPLNTPGKKWYICEIADHCSQGMKLVITVSGAEAPAPAPVWRAPSPPPGPSASPDRVSPLKSGVWMVAVMAAYRMILA